MLNNNRKALRMIFIIGVSLIIIRHGYANRPIVSVVAEYTERECMIEGDYPKVGEIFTVKYRVRMKKNTTSDENYYVSMWARSTDPVEIIDDQEVKIQGLSHDMWKEVRFRVKIIEPMMTIKLIINIRLEGTRDRAATQSIVLVLTDPLTGQYGEYEQNYPQLYKGAEWHYDPAGEFVHAPDHVSPACAKTNLKIIAHLQEIDPQLTNWEAVYLHYDGLQAVMSSMGPTGTTEEEIWRFFLKSGWLDKQRTEKDTKEQWLKELIDNYKGQPLAVEGGSATNFFVLLIIVILILSAILIVLKAGGRIFTSKDNPETKNTNAPRRKDF